MFSTVTSSARSLTSEEMEEARLEKEPERQLKARSCSEASEARTCARACGHARGGGTQKAPGRGTTSDTQIRRSSDTQTRTWDDG